MPILRSNTHVMHCCNANTQTFFHLSSLQTWQVQVSTPFTFFYIQLELCVLNSAYEECVTNNVVDGPEGLKLKQRVVELSLAEINRTYACMFVNMSQHHLGLADKLEDVPVLCQSIRNRRRVFMTPTLLGVHYMCHCVLRSLILLEEVSACGVR